MELYRQGKSHDSECQRYLFRSIAHSACALHSGSLAEMTTARKSPPVGPPIVRFLFAGRGRGAPGEKIPTKLVSASTAGQEKMRTNIMATRMTLNRQRPFSQIRIQCRLMTSCDGPLGMSRAHSLLRLSSRNGFHGPTRSG